MGAYDSIIAQLDTVLCEREPYQLDWFSNNFEHILKFNAGDVFDFCVSHYPEVY